MRSYQRLFSSIILCIIFNPYVLYGQLTAIIKYEYCSQLSNYSNITQDSRINGVVSSKGSQSIVRNGQAFTLVDATGKYDACQDTIKPIKYFNGVAIIQRGGSCTFSIKITRAKQYGAAGVIIYDPTNNDQSIYDMYQNNSDITAVYVERSFGAYLFNLANDNQAHLNITIEPSSSDQDSDNGGIWYTSRGVIVFIIISICILICLCATWFGFYYCQRYRLRTSKDRLQNRLINAAKKALAKIPLVTITANSLVEESCVICLETIKIGDTVRKIVCGHTFHQNCVDPWLINHRHCPLCNLDILVAYRVSIPGENNPQNVVQIPMPSLATTAAVPIINNDQQVTIPMPLPTISGALKDERHGEQNPSYRSDADDDNNNNNNEQH